MKHILVISFFPAFFPPSSGGEQRLFYFYKHLSEHFDITLLAPTFTHAEYEEVRHGDHFKAIRVPKEPLVDTIHWQLDASGIGPECSGLALALAGSEPSAFATKLGALAREADVVVHESPFTVPYDTSLLSDGKPRIYNSYNLEANLARQMFSGFFAEQATRFVARLERVLAGRADHVFVTSPEEIGAFVETYDIEPARISLASNGFEPVDEAANAHAWSGTSNDSFYAVFMGSQHPPNIEAGRFILSSLASQLPEIRFIIFGAVCTALESALLLPANVQLLGRVDELTKLELLSRCGVALNPMFSGAGTNLKMFDYLAFGACVVTTPVGARGINLENRKEALIVPSDQMAAAIREVAHSPTLRHAIGSAARQRAYADYSWREIVANAAPYFKHVLSRRATLNERSVPLRVLILNDYAIGDGSGGGQRRLRELTSGLSQRCHVHILCLGDVATVAHRQLRVRLHETIVPKTEAHKAHERRTAQLSYVSVSDIVAGLECRDNETLKHHLNSLAEAADIVVLEHPYLSPLLSDLPADKLVVYSAQNVERDLKVALLKVRPDAEEMLEHVVSLENYACSRARLIVCVSEEDARRFESMFVGRTTVVISNGVESRPHEATCEAGRHGAAGRRLRSVFVGSAHLPNIEAVEFIADSLAAACPQIDFDIVGDCGDVLARRSLPPNVVVHGKVSDADKALVLRNASIGINPMFSGGGSSLKMPEMMSYGLPVVSTEIGARGYGFVPDTHYVSASIDQFGVHLNRLTHEFDRASAIGDASALYVQKHFTWSRLARRYSDALMTTCAAVPRRVRVLAVSFRYAMPIRGGAELYLDRLLDNLHRRHGHEIDLATFAVDAIENRFHFSATYVPSAEHPAKPAFAKHVHWFDVDPIEHAHALATSRQLFALWAGESLVRGRMLASSIEMPIVMGGWNFPETLPDGATARWTTGRAEFQVLPAGGTIHITGHAARKTRMKIECDDRVVAEVPVSGSFSTTATMPAKTGRVAIVVTDLLKATDDPRTLGVLINSIAIDSEGGRYSIRLDHDVETVTRKANPAKLIESLIDTVESRDPSFADAFIDVRGPRSECLDAWLATHVGQYDVVIAHGAPFRPMVAAQRAAAAAGIPTLVLPHFHADDPYYHWQEFYETFRSGDRVAAAPERSKADFFDRISSSAISLPGGGIQVEEFREDEMQRCAQIWSQREVSENPFVLVLGRKAAAKHYMKVVEAVKLAREIVPDLECWLIGPDDGGLSVHEPFVRELGMQPREIVLGALASCLCLANMSASESFGIVILEAWMAGVPVVVEGTTPAFAELVEDGIDGHLVTNVEDAARAFVTLAGDRAATSLKGRRGHEKALRYAWPAIADSFAEQLDQIVAVQAHFS